MRSGARDILRIALAAFLALWEPLAFASTLAATLASIAGRGWPAVVEITWAGAVAMIAVAAAWSVWTGAPHGAPLARVAIVGGALRDIQQVCWTWLPSDVAPGARGVLVAVSIGAAGAAWLLSLAVACFGAGD